eukprot:TRINITY_DN61690_c0_g1_i1.p1 TRINITY_DN61690_c0_g1~~TRINITY_DN61690_c0_g1_i1.p1  ORF type:complete len:624 (+),score=98.19 TRINITY_DN61690_c0_g1_i1:164-1873(+)
MHLRVVGSTAALGSWDPCCGVTLSTSANDFPLWRQPTPIEIDESEIVEYKYVVCDNSGKGVRWEERMNRIVNLPALVSARMIPANGDISVAENFCTNDSDDLRFRTNKSALPAVARNPSFEKSRSWVRQQSSSLLNNLGGFGNDRENSQKSIAGGDAGAANSDLFAPTIRERMPSMSLLSHEGSFRRDSMSHFGDLAEMGGVSAEGDALVNHAGGYNSRSPAGHAPPEVTETSETVLAAGDASAENLASNPDGGLTALVREESCSNLFMGVDAEEEPVRDEDEFERSYSLVGHGPLGEGTFGLVWLCTPKTPNRLGSPDSPAPKELAAKIVRKARLQPRDMRYLLGEDGEVQLHLTMKHPHIVQLFEYFDEPATVTLVLEYCQGGDLFDAIVAQSSKKTSRGFTGKQSVVATRHVLSALAYIHEQSVVHRDIKCENILLQHRDIAVEDNVFKLCDFGFAAHDKGEGLTDRLGSPDTVAPEVVVGTKYSTPADLWSTGVLVYMMLSAQPPFYGSTDQEVLRKVRTGSYSLTGEPWDSTSPEAKNLISSLMTVEPKLRPTATEALGVDWLK